MFFKNKYRKLFGTDGIRGIANEHPIDVTSCYRLVCVLVRFFKLNNMSIDRVMIGKDTRKSSHMLEAALSAAFCSCGVNVILLGTIPTATMSVLLDMTHKADIGVMITASHNQHQYNGLKFFLSDGSKFDDNFETAIESMFFDNDSYDSSYNFSIGLLDRDTSMLQLYVDNLVSQFYFSRDILEKYMLFIDCANGSASYIVESILKKLGFNLQVFNNNPDGENINLNCGVCNPEFILSKILEYKTSNDRLCVGIIFDGDADRVLCIDEDGYLIDGDKILAILSEIYISANKAIVATIMSSLSFEKYLASKQIRLLRSQVGDRSVLKLMNQQTPPVMLGGEKSGHILIKEYANSSDGIYTVLKLLEYCFQTGIKLVDVNKIYEDYPIVIRDIEVRNPVICAKVEERILYYREILGNDIRILARVSGTEPVVRFVVEHRDMGTAKYIMDELVELFYNEG